MQKNSEDYINKAKSKDLWINSKKQQKYLEDFKWEYSMII